MRQETSGSPRILIVCNSLGGGGAENIMRFLHQSLVESGMDSNLLSLMKDQHSESRNNANEFTLSRKWGGNLLQTLVGILEFNKMLKVLHPTIIVINCELPELYISFVRTTGSRVFCVEHTSRPWAGREFIGKFVRRILKFRRFEWVTVVKDQLSVWACQNSPKFIANPLMIKPNYESATHQEKTGLLYFGRIREEKRPEMAIIAALESKEAIDLFGEGELLGALQLKYSGNDSVKFQGYVNEGWDFVSNNRLVIVPSEYEGDGMVVVEAVARNHPILLADNKDFRRFAFPPENYFNSLDDLVQKIKIGKKQGYKNYLIPKQMREDLMIARDPKNYVEKWKTLLIK